VPGGWYSTNKLAWHLANLSQPLISQSFLSACEGKKPDGGNVLLSDSVGCTAVTAPRGYTTLMTALWGPGGNVREGAVEGFAGSMQQGK